jgi:hypothetical protein
MTERLINRLVAHRRERREDAVDLKLGGRVALVTGSTAGIRFAIARSLAREAARVYVNGRTRQRVDEAILAIRSHSREPRWMASKRIVLILLEHRESLPIFRR